MSKAATLKQVMDVLTLISQGHTPSAACMSVGTSWSTVKRTVANTPELHEVFADAEQSHYDTLADILLNIDNDLIYGTSDVKKMKVLSDNIKWYLSKRANSKYGDKVVVEHNITADRAVTDALARGRERALGRVIDAVAVDVTERALRAIPAPTQKPATIDAAGFDDCDVSQFV